MLDNSQKHLKDKRIHIVAAPGRGKTILGLELVRRQNAPALVMSPSVTIRQQWGERIVEEIFVPQLVMQKTLCPHQDYIFFSYPTAEESQILANYKAKATAVTDEIIRSGLLSKALQVSNAAGNEEILYDNLTYRRVR